MHDYELRTLPAMLANHATQRGDAPFLIEEDGVLAYDEAFSLSRRVAAGFVRCGVKRGDHVALMLDNRREFFLSWLALGLMGAVEVPVHQQSVGDRLIHVLNHSESTLLVVQAEYLDQVEAVAGGLTSLERIVVLGDRSSTQLAQIAWEELDDGTEAPPAPVRFSDPIAVMYTSGSTGAAKGAVLSHGHHYTNGYQAMTAVGISPEDVVFAATPFHHNMAQGYGAWPTLVAGASMRLAPRFDRHTFWDDVTRHGATVLPFVGAMLVLLAKAPPTDGDRDNPLRVGYGVPIPPDLHRAFEERFGLTLVHVYGSTEATIVAWATGDGAVPGAAGRIFPGYDVRIHDEDDRPLEQGEMGEICVRPDEPYTMFSGYYRDPERTATVFRNTWFHTGDRGWFDERGVLWFGGRMGDAMRCKGENVSAQEVEDVFLNHPAVSLVAAYGIPAELGDEEIVIAVVPQAGEVLDPDELLRWAEGRLARYALPRYVDQLDELPMTPTGKVKKHELRESGPSKGAFDRLGTTRS
jgi:crotonobetaine/carnitine-CoA ligase